MRLRIGTLLFGLIGPVFAWANSARAGELQVAIIVGGDLRLSQWDLDPKTHRMRDTVSLPQRTRAEIKAFEESLWKIDPTLDLAVIRCKRADRQSPEEAVVHDFGGSFRDLADHLEEPLPGPAILCPASIDLFDQAIEHLAWKNGTKKRIVALGEPASLLTSGHASMEEVVHRAERHGIILHVLALHTVERGRLFSRSSAALRDLEPILTDVGRFLDMPVAPLGRVPEHPRHATLLSGGTYEPVVLPSRSPWALRNRGVRSRDDERVARAIADVGRLLDRAFGPVTDGKDALDDLAEGKRRPSELSNTDVPKALQGINLEPLLDAVFDFVDARRVANAALLELEALEREDAIPVGVVGARFGTAVAGPLRLMPSRR